jgi:hypothetical protein
VLFGGSCFAYYSTRIIDWRESRKRREFGLSLEFDPIQHVWVREGNAHCWVLVRNVGIHRLDAIGVKIDAIREVPINVDVPACGPSDAIGNFLCLAKFDNPGSVADFPVPERFSLDPGEAELISVATMSHGQFGQLLVTDFWVHPQTTEFAFSCQRKHGNLGSRTYAIRLHAFNGQASCRRDFTLKIGGQFCFEEIVLGSLIPPSGKAAF